MKIHWPIAWILATALGVSSAVNAVGQTGLTQDEAIRLAFPEPAVIERQPVFLSEVDLAEVRELAGFGVEVKRPVITRYEARDEGGTLLGWAYFESHRVRTLPEVIMVVVTPDAEIRHIEVLQFLEPPQYEAPAAWIEQLYNRPLSDDLSLKGRIAGITGATLTAQALTQAARRILALHAFVEAGAE